MTAHPPASDPSIPPGRTAPVVLIVDDDDAVRTSLLRLLKALGYQARGYASGETFLADLSGPHADCVVLDLLMPALQGDRVVAAMRQVWPDVPVIFITGSDDPGMDERLMAAGGRAWFMKPVDPRVLVAEIQAATRGARPEARGDPTVPASRGA